MNKETQSIIRNYESTMQGQPWFGRAVMEILLEVDESKAQIKPGNEGHSLLELIWHMNTWAEFVLAHLEKRTEQQIKQVESIDWRQIDPGTHTWARGVSELKTTHEKILEILSGKQDDFLKEMVPGRQFNFRFMLNGLIQHNIYHLGQIAYIHKFLTG